MANAFASASVIFLRNRKPVLLAVFGFFALPFFVVWLIVFVHRWVIGVFRVAFILTLRSSGTSPQLITVKFFRFLRSISGFSLLWGVTP